MSPFVVLGPASSIEEGKSQVFEVSGRSIAVFKRDGQFYAIDDLCPHMGASLAAGELEGCIVACPWHGWRFDIRDGSWRENPRIRTDTFPVRVVADSIEVQVPERETDTRVLADGPGPEAGTPDRKLTCREDQMNSAESGKADLNTAAEERDTAGPRLGDFQQLIRNMYYEKDLARGVSGTFMWLMEEIGELATALRSDDRENLAAEFADVLAWLATIANVAEVDLSAAVAKKYGRGCPGCSRLVCVCPDSEKP